MTVPNVVAELEPIYFANEQDIDRNIFLPIVKIASSISCMSGYFASGALRELASSLSHFLTTKNGPMRFIVGPNLEEQDLAALRLAIRGNENVIPMLFPGYDLSEDNLRTRTINVLAYLIATKRLEMKIALQEQGLFHTKCWVFETAYGGVSIHGSVNATQSGLSINTEQFGLSKEWESQADRRVVLKIRKVFESLWNGMYTGVETLELNIKTVEFLSKIYKRKCDVNDWKSYLTNKLLEEFGPRKTKKHKPQLVIPGWLNFQTGEYAHQGKAVNAWLEKGKGILSIATGGGKTHTALIAASKINLKEDNLLVVIAVPTKALLNQWSNDVRSFSVIPQNTFGSPKKEVKRELKSQIRRLRLGASKSEVIVMTHDALKSDLINILEKASEDVSIMLIGDEVHNLGSVGFQVEAKHCFKYLLGLSATYSRQFDEEGTEFLLNYFGDVVFDFPLKQAIGNCLVPYDYHVHRIELDDEEQDLWSELTEKIRKLNFAAELADGNPEKDRWKILCLQRRKIAESASGKIFRLAEILPKNKSKIRRTLFFCTDKNPKQLKDLNGLLSKRTINFHQVTAEETSSTKDLSRIVQSFGSGELQVLTSKRVLDEGFNIPQTETAYFLASNTVKRQWVQRLGRVLRLSPATRKEKSTVHDFVVVAKFDSGKVDKDLRSLVQNEFDRVKFFSELSSNGLEKGGSIELMNELLFFMEK